MSTQTNVGNGKEETMCSFRAGHFGDEAPIRTFHVLLVGNSFECFEPLSAPVDSRCFATGRSCKLYGCWSLFFHGR